MQELRVKRFEVTSAHLLVGLSPRSLPTQQVRDHQLYCTPEPTHRAHFDDASGNQVFAANGRPLHPGLCQGSAVGFFDEQGNALAGNLGLEAEGEDRKTTTKTNDWGATLQLQHRGKIILVPQPFQQSAHPRRVRSCFDHNPAG